MGLNRISNKQYADLLKKNYKEWKKEGLSKGGYFIIFNGFLAKNKLKNISGNALKLYIYLGLNSKNMTGEVWHSNKSIAKYFGKSERTIRNWMKELEDMHLIKRIQLEYSGVAHTFLQPYELDENKRKFVYRYRLKNKNYREKINLTEYSKAIIDGVHHIFPNVEVNVYPGCFDLITDTELNSSDLRKMGHEIKIRDKRFEKFIVKYKYVRNDGSLAISTQLFERI